EWNSGDDQHRLRWMIYHVVLADVAESAEIGESSLTGLELVQETTDKVVLVKEKPKAARNIKRAMLIMGGKLAPRFIGPFKILEGISLVTYRLTLPEQLNSVHDTFHVLNLKKCLANTNLHVPLDEIKVDKTLRFVEEHIEIMDREAEIGESSLTGLELVQETTDKVVLVKEKPKAARNHQKSYVDYGRKPFEFDVGDRVLLKLNSVHDTFHVLNLKKCLANTNLHVPLDEIKVDKTHRFVEEHIEIIDREVGEIHVVEYFFSFRAVTFFEPMYRQAKLSSKFLIIKVRWILKRRPAFTWEHEDQMKIKNRGKAIVNSPQPIYDQEPSMVDDDDETSKDKEIDKLMALISLSFKKIYKPTNNNLRTSSNTSRTNQDNSPWINKNARYESQRIGNVAGASETTPKRAKDAAYHREKMLLCKQEEVGIQLNAE
nr:putative reverse transcriptase domain-containing protein [Tanacetum cinerariifolium]